MKNKKGTPLLINAYLHLLYFGRNLLSKRLRYKTLKSKERTIKAKAKEVEDERHVRIEVEMNNCSI